MKIAIIGAGFGALAAAFDLSKNKNNIIELIDPNQSAGGLSAGFEKETWNWSLEEHYHHIFDTDKAFKQFLEELGLRDQLVYRRAKSSTLYKGKIWQIDTPLALMKFKEISFWSRIRTGMVLAFLMILPNGIVLENIRASQFLIKTMGKESWQVIWEPLFKSKFGRFKDEVNLSWFWARVHPRSAKLGYFNGGFKRLADLIVEKLTSIGVVFSLEKKVEKITKMNDKFSLSIVDMSGNRETKEYDLVISTLPSSTFSKIVDLPELKNGRLIGLGAMTVLLRLKNKLLKDGTYWLNVNEKKWPFVAIVEHDNLVNAENYACESLVYLGRYLEPSDKEFKKTANQLLKDYLPYLKKIDSEIEDYIIEASVFKTPFAQPISSLGQSRFLPSYNTSLKNLYWVSMQHVYPFDRGLNHAVLSARKLVKHVRMEVSNI